MLITKVIALNHSSCFEDIFSISILFVRQLFRQNPMDTGGVIKV